MIAGDNLRSTGTYSELRNLFSSRDDNDRKVSISPSKRVDEISSAQVYCQAPKTGFNVIYVTQSLPDHMTGDLRLAQAWVEDFDRDKYTKEMTETQYITKYTDRRGEGSDNVHIYRRMMVYLRMAEALNMAGYPRMAFKILSEGVNSNTILRDVIPHYYGESNADSLYLSKFDFRPTSYQLITIDDYRGSASQNHNMMGIHTRGSGWTPLNEYYQLPESDPIPYEVLIPNSDEEETYDTITIWDTPIVDSPELIAQQQAFVDSLILNESALEFAFEGTRYYDIMRYAMRQPNPGKAMGEIIGARLGEANRSSMSAIIDKLADQRNWYLNCKGKICY